MHCHKPKPTPTTQSFGGLNKGELSAFVRKEVRTTVYL